MSTYEPTGVESTGTTTSDSTQQPSWEGPFCEPNAYGGTTGYDYVRCTGCGIEVLSDERAHATHRPECDHR